MTDETTQGKGGLLKRLGIAGAALAVALALFFAFDLQRFLDPQELLTLLDGIEERIAANLLPAAIVFTLLYAAAVAISVPGATILTIAGGFLFGQWTGTVSVVLGATAGAIVIFALAKWAFRDALASRASGFLKKMERGFREDELNYMFLLRLVPAFPFFAVNIGAGVLNVRMRNYVLGTFFGIIPGTFVYVSIGNAIAKGSATLADTGLASVFSQPAVYLPFIGLALLGALPILIKRFGGKRAESLVEEAQ